LLFEPGRYRRTAAVDRTAVGIGHCIAGDVEMPGDLEYMNCQEAPAPCRPRTGSFVETWRMVCKWWTPVSSYRGHERWSQLLREALEFANTKDITNICRLPPSSIFRAEVAPRRLARVVQTPSWFLALGE
jgi:hypothetical protein